MAGTPFLRGVSERKLLSFLWSLMIHAALGAYNLRKLFLPAHSTHCVIDAVATLSPLILFSLVFLCYVIFDVTCQFRFRFGLDEVLIDTRTNVGVEGEVSAALQSRRNIYLSVYPLAVVFPCMITFYALPELVLKCA